MLSLQIPPRALHGDRSDALGSVLGQHRALARLEFPGVIGLQAARDNPRAIVSGGIE
jgi:hypothetical protein